MLTTHLCISDPTAQQLPIPHSSTSDIIQELVQEIINMVDSLKEKANAKETPVCFVLDGEPLHAKELTHKSRSKKSRGFLKKAWRSANLFLARPDDEQNEVQFRNKFRTCAFGWVRWFKELKELVVEKFLLHGASPDFDPEQPAPLSIVTAPFEADPKVVELGHRVSVPSLLFSNDGDLLVYPYADRSMVFQFHHSSCFKIYTPAKLFI